MSVETPAQAAPRTGSEKLIRLPASAGQKVNQLMHRDGVANGALRVKIVGGGCAGLEYKMDFENNPPTAKDILIESAGVRVLVDGFSAGYLRGAVLEFDDAMMGGGFKITNPNARQSCGCGKSFDT